MFQTAINLWIRRHGKDTIIKNVTVFAYDYYSRTLNVSYSDGTDETFTDVSAMGA